MHADRHTHRQAYTAETLVFTWVFTGYLHELSVTTYRQPCAVNSNGWMYLIYLLAVSRNHQGRRGTTADIGDNLLPSLTVIGCSLMLLKSRPVHSLMLSSHLFFCLPLFLFPGTVPCRTFLQRPLDLVTCPNHRNFLFSQLLISIYVGLRTDV